MQMIDIVAESDEDVELAMNNLKTNAVRGNQLVMTKKLKFDLELHQVVYMHFHF